MLSTHTHDNNLEILESYGPDAKYCYITGFNDEGDRLVGCCLFDESHYPNHETRDGKLVHLDPDEGSFTSEVASDH